MNDTLTLTISDITNLGSGVGRLADGCAVFVPGTCIGETVKVKILQSKKKFATAQLLEVITPSPDRLTPPCATAPGITYGHMTYAAELAAKQKQLTNFLTRSLKLDTELLRPAVPSPQELGYRNKIVLHTGMARGRRVLGYVGDDNRTIIDMPQCPLAHGAINQRLKTLRNNPQALRGLQAGQKLTLRYTETDGVLDWVGFPPHGVELTETTLLGPVKVAAGGFFQVNIPAVNLLLDVFKKRFSDASTPKSSVIDLYCGAGLFSIAAGQCGAEQLLGIEINSGAIASARKNAELHQLNKAYFSCAQSETITGEQLLRKSSQETTLIVDPPREGLTDTVRQTILANPPQKIFYVSCGPDTLIRDLKDLLQGGYTLKRVQLFDFFPRTPHFETFTELQLQP